MNIPIWLPSVVGLTYQLWKERGNLTGREEAFFADPRLKEFWAKMRKHLITLEHPEFMEAAAESIPGVFLTPLEFYMRRGTREQPTPKVRIRERQKKADELIARAAKQAGELAQTLESLESTTTIYPCETRLMTIVRKLVRDTNLNHIPSYFDGVRTSDALRLLEAKLKEYPNASSIFDDVPGMASNQSSWRDWLWEAESNYQDFLRIHPGKCVLAEADWVNLAKVLIGNTVSRENVQAALRKQHD